jgi:hypothetical protein
MTVLLAGTSIARAVDVAPYQDERDSNYLKVPLPSRLSRRQGPPRSSCSVPCTRLPAPWGSTDPDTRRDEDDLGACLTFRPMRKCSGRD